MVRIAGAKILKSFNPANQKAENNCFQALRLVLILIYCKIELIISFRDKQLLHLFVQFRPGGFSTATTRPVQKLLICFES
jgi:hypothetical protein